MNSLSVKAMARRDIYGLQSRDKGCDIDPGINAQRLPCFLSGERKNYSRTMLKSYGSTINHQPKDLAPFYWQSGRHHLKLVCQAFDVKQELYRQITLLIDALGVQHNISAHPNL